MKAEFIACYKAANRAISLRDFIQKLNEYHGSKLIEVKYMTLKEKVKRYDVPVEHIETDNMVADPLTKDIRPCFFERHVLDSRISSYELSKCFLKRRKRLVVGEPSVWKQRGGGRGDKASSNSRRRGDGFGDDVLSSLLGMNNGPSEHASHDSTGAVKRISAEGYDLDSSFLEIASPVALDLAMMHDFSRMYRSLCKSEISLTAVSQISAPKLQTYPFSWFSKHAHFVMVLPAPNHPTTIFSCEPAAPPDHHEEYGSCAREQYHVAGSANCGILITFLSEFGDRTVAAAMHGRKTGQKP
ncbi:hypothetical protein AKJ16_DCAP16885 [Drosera capensis]